VRVTMVTRRRARDAIVHHASLSPPPP
jgi:hypothetical protein